jgi:cytochrome aa3-600 menaquinol oxidase subunit 2
MGRFKLGRFPTKIGALGLMALALTGCGPQYVLFHPAGPVAQGELNLLVLASVAMGVVILGVYLLLAIALVRFREGPKRPPGIYAPEWDGDRRLEAIWFLVPVVLLTIIAVPTVRETFHLADPPPARGDPVVIDVTSLTWKWLFEYPKQHIATVNYVVIPAGQPVLFELTADSAMDTFWVPRLGGMEYTMPNQVLPLWLEASRPGRFWGHSANFSGLDFEQMFFTVRAVPPSTFAQWADGLRHTAKPMTLSGYRRLLQFGVVGEESYGAYPASTFPYQPTGFTLTGDGMYTLMKARPMGSGAHGP